MTYLSTLFCRRTKTLMPLKETLLKPRCTKYHIEKMTKENDRQAGYYNPTAQLKTRKNYNLET